MGESLEIRCFSVLLLALMELKRGGGYCHTPHSFNIQ